jgi:hypothetical protein
VTPSFVSREGNEGNGGNEAFLPIDFVIKLLIPFFLIYGDGSRDRTFVAFVEHRCLREKGTNELRAEER